LTRQGEIRWVSDAAVELTGDNGASTGFIGILQDITDRKRAEEEVRLLNVVLEQRVRERTAELEASNKELESFSYSVSHDLRAPLRGIDGYSKLLVDEYGSQLNDEAHSYLLNIRKAAQKMGQLIDDLLLLSRVTRAEMHREETDLSTLAREIFETLSSHEPSRRVETFIKPNMMIQADPNLIRIMLRNLIGNAWKFTSKTPQPRIEVSSFKENGETIYFIRDNGAGFDMKYANRLFTAFQRLHNPGDFDGTGIGLATVQRVINRHGGRIWAKGEVNQGATFLFVINS
jgi:light-regulated signal transduction histidine kinase (bacteriophytochrome)